VLQTKKMLSPCAFVFLLVASAPALALPAAPDAELTTIKDLRE
jgi:hypothetical protein